MNQDQTITVRYWWENATHSGRVKFGNLENFALVSGLSERELQRRFEVEITTLKEWWEGIGQFVYKQIAGLAKELSALLPAGEFPRTTLSDYIRRGRLPQFTEYYAVLYAVTALPVFDLGKASISLTIPVGRGTQFFSEEDLILLTGLAQAKGFGDALVRKIREITGSDLSRLDREKVEQLVERVIRKLLEMVEDMQLVQQVNELFGG